MDLLVVIDMREGATKSLVFRLLRASRLLDLLERHARGLSILAYHGVTDQDDDRLRNRRRLHIPIARFEEHLRLLKREWMPLSLHAAVQALQKGRLPPRAVAVTFDDGYRNQITTALPLLRSHGVPATFFVLTDPPRRLWLDQLESAIQTTRRGSIEWRGRRLTLDSDTAKSATLRCLGRELCAMNPGERRQTLESLLESLGNEGLVDKHDDRDLLSWEDVLALRQADMEVGSHGDNHEFLTARADDELTHALSRSRRALEKHTGPGEFALSFPFGRTNNLVREASRSAGFYCAVTTNPGRNSSATSMFGLRRSLVGADDDVFRLRMRLSGLGGPWNWRLIDDRW